MCCCSQAGAELVGLDGALRFLQEVAVCKNSLQQIAKRRVQQLKMQRCFAVPYSGSAEEQRDSAFQGEVWVQALLTLTQLTKSQWNFFFPDTENRKQQNYRLGEMYTNWCVEDSTSKAGGGKIRNTFLVSAEYQPNSQSWSCSHFYCFPVILLENHSSLPEVWDIAELDLEHFNDERITITDLRATLYAGQVQFGLQTSAYELGFWFGCFKLWFAGHILLYLLLHFILQLLNYSSISISSLSALIYLWKTSFLIKVPKTCCQGLSNLRIWFKLPEKRHSRSC